jgi:pre-mRNA-processing factor 8
VKEVRCIVMPPQIGNHQGVTVPYQFPDHEMLKDLEPLGWIHTQPNETPVLPPADCILMARFIADVKSWSLDRCVTITCSFTPGSCSLTAYKLTQPGLDWGKKYRDTGTGAPEYKRWILLSLTPQLRSGAF